MLLIESVGVLSCRVWSTKYVVWISGYLDPHRHLDSDTENHTWARKPSVATPFYRRLLDEPYKPNELHEPHDEGGWFAGWRLLPKCDIS